MRQHFLRQDLPVGRDDEQVGLQAAEHRHAFGRVDALRLEDGNALLGRDLLHPAADLAGAAALLRRRRGPAG